MSGLPTIFPPFATLHSSGEFLGEEKVNSSIIMATEKHVSGLLVILREARKGKAEETEGDSRREEKCEKANAGLVGDGMFVSPTHA